MRVLACSASRESKNEKGPTPRKLEGGNGGKNYEEEGNLSPKTLQRRGTPAGRKMVVGGKYSLSPIRMRKDHGEVAQRTGQVVSGG